MTTSKEDELYLQEALRKGYGLTLEKIPETSDKTPDFHIKHGALTIAVAELKSFVQDVPDVENGWQKVGDGILEKITDDNGPARVARKIKQAYMQLQKYELPKILVLMNHESLLDQDDLQECYDGYLWYSDGKISFRNVASRRIANGDIKELKDKIDLYIWIDMVGEKTLFFRYTTPRGHELSMRYFGGEPR